MQEEYSAPEIVEGITAIIKEFHTRLPDSKVLLLGVFQGAD